jgi:hypothetical protein
VRRSLQEAVRDARAFCADTGSSCYVLAVPGGFIVSEWVGLEDEIAVWVHPES